MSLFEDPVAPELGDAPLAERMRPATFEDFVGQEHLGEMLRKGIEDGTTGSLILFGPPGSGKTTLALLIAKASGLHFEPFSAVLSGVKDVRAAVARAREIRDRTGEGTLLFVDEIHRFNKAQQDAFLPYVEQGVVVLVGATTENPSFTVVGALLSRCRAVQLMPLSDEAVTSLVGRALEDAERGLGERGLQISEPAAARLVELAGGDARRALTALEALAAGVEDGACIDVAAVVEAFQHRALLHDRSGDNHFDLLSAFHKSLRNSDVQATVYWLARMIEAGADPLQAARRMIAMAAEDIGLADPMALQVAVSAHHAAHQLGLPEARLPLVEAAIYLAAAPKSNAAYRAIDGALAEVRSGRQHGVPLHLRNAPTDLAKKSGHGAGYVYAHDQDGGVAGMSCLPEELRDARFYEPGSRGFEQKIADRMREADRLRDAEER